MAHGRGPQAAAAPLGESVMNPIYVPLLSALAGAIIGTAASIATILIQAKINDRRERTRQAVTLALEEIKFQAANAKPGTGILPVSVYLYHQLAVLKAIEENDFTAERLRKITDETDALIATVRELEPIRQAR
jgi:NhaP-type Na+/H+ or K+/H+ antiporter